MSYGSGFFYSDGGELRSFRADVKQSVRFCYGVNLHDSSTPHRYHGNQHIDERTDSDTKPVSFPANPALKAKQSDKAQGYPKEK